MDMLQQQYEIFSILRLESGYFEACNTQQICSDEKLEDVTLRDVFELKRYTF